MLFACNAAQAQTSSLPFGLDDLHWRMTPGQAAPHYPRHGDRHALPPDWFSGRPESVGPYSWKGCRITAYLYFEGAGDALDSVMLRVPADASDACLGDLRAELVANFGTPQTVSGKPVAGGGGAALRAQLHWFSAAAKRCRDVPSDSGICGDRLKAIQAKAEQDANVMFFRDYGRVMLWAPGMPRHYQP